MTQEFTFSLLKTDGGARLGRIDMPRGTIRTPAFMPVGTQGTVKGLYPDQVREAGADIILGNTYHLMLRPGAERVARLGGLHRLIRWDGPILTDSGGFQVMSLGALRKVTEEGVEFRSHIDGSKHFMSPERSMEIQRLLGSDIQMQLDECVAYPHTFEEAERAMELSLRWALRSREAFGEQRGRACFGIVQGGIEPELRERSARGLIARRGHVRLRDAHPVGPARTGLHAVGEDQPEERPFRGGHAAAGAGQSASCSPGPTSPTTSS